MRLTYVSLLIFAMACGGNDDSAEDDSDGGTANGDAGSPADGGGGEDVDAGNGLCSQDPQPTGPDSPCPDPCDTCEGGVCTVDCGQGSCNGVTDCPDDYECVVLCDGENACDGGGVNCPTDHACSVVCSNGNDACGDFDLTCGAGSCSIDCEDDTCDGAVVHCGPGECTGSCAGASPAMVECADSCSCTEC